MKVHNFNFSKILSNKELEDLYKKLINKTEKVGQFFYTKEINVQFEKKENEIITQIDKGSFGEVLNILYIPIKLTIDNSPFDPKVLFIYAINYLSSIIIKLSEKYDIYHENSKISSNCNFYQIKELEAKKKIKFDIQFFDSLIYREKTKLESFGVFDIPKLYLSPYFNEIAIYDTKKDKFNFIYDENRQNFFNKINNFWKSDNLFFWLLGNDGIGKTISILYYSSLISEFKKIYINFKLFKNKNRKEIKKIFFNEIMNIFITDKKEQIKYERTNYINLIKDIKFNMKKNNLKKSDCHGFEYFWNIFFIFVDEFVYSYLNFSLLIILDQYKTNDIDENFFMLNSLSDKINEKQKYKKIKLLILSSINNSDIKQVFIENIFSLDVGAIGEQKLKVAPYFKSVDVLNSIENISSIQTEFDIDSDFEEIETCINERIDEIKTNLNKMLNNYKKDKYDSNVDSKCYLNNKYHILTRKEYLNKIVTSESILDDYIKNNFKNCIENFNYSLKYYELLKEEIQNNKENQEKEDYQEKIEEDFYKKMYKRVKDNIDRLYINKMSKMNPEELNKLEEKKYQFLFDLRNAIYNETTYLISDLKLALSKYPTKYLNVYIAGIEGNNIIPLDTNKISNFTYYIDYSNNFIRQSINKIINEVSSKFKNSNLVGSGFGWDLEEKVCNTLSKMKINNTPVEKRDIFAIIGTTKNSKKTIDSLRKIENTPFYKFYENQLYNKKIDGIDKIDKFNPIGKNVFLNQISKKGESFDCALMISLNKNNNNYTHNLVLGQTTKSKINKCKKKTIYISDSLKSKTYLENLYPGLKFKNVYFLFILPYKYKGIEETINKLNSEKISYIFFSYNESAFYNQNDEKIENFCIKEALINYSDKDFSLDITINNIEKFHNNFRTSVYNYLGKKKHYGNKYINAFKYKMNERYFDYVKIKIPSAHKKNMKTALIDNGLFSQNDDLKFLFSGNCKGTEIEKIFEKTKSNNLILFSYKKNVYFYYKYYFQFIGEKIIKLDNNLDIKKNTYYRPKGNKIEFEKITSFPLLCFCFDIIVNFKKYLEDNED